MMQNFIPLPTPKSLPNFMEQIKNDPELLQAYRAYAQQVYEACAQPTSKDGDWRFSNAYNFEGSWHVRAVQVPYIPLIDGAFLSDIRYFFHRYPDKVRQILAYDADGSWKNNNIAAFAEGYFTQGRVLYIPKDVQIQVPISLFQHCAGQESVIEKIIIFAQEGSSVIIDDEVSFEHSAKVMRSVTVIAQKYASITWNSYDRFMQGSMLSDYRFYIEDYAHFLGNGCWITSHQNHRWLGWNLMGVHAHMHMRGTYLLGDSNNLALHTLQHHTAVDTLSRIAFKGIGAHRSQSIFQGMIRIDHDAARSDADMHNKTMLMHAASHAVSEPQIEVLTDDVACSHGSAVGQLDSYDLFYVQSRGICPERS
ncbi:MAG: SufD family Fe-S cluster assembly protein [Candidatus Babeliales bacterium]